jgi:hypothetical protein
MKHYAAHVVIDAPPEVVWAVLVDGPSYPEWDSGVTRVDGVIADGATITVHSEASPGRSFPVRVAVAPPGRMSWTGGMPLGLFRGVRTFGLTPVPDGGTRFTMREEFSGPLLRLIWPTMPDLGPSFVQFVTGLRSHVEARHRTA